MKQRQHRRDVRKRMAKAPDLWTRERLMHLGLQWSRRELKALANRQWPRMEFKMAHIRMMDPSQIIGRTFRRADMPGHIIVTDTYALMPYQQAICDALVKGEGWVEVGVKST